MAKKIKKKEKIAKRKILQGYVVKAKMDKSVVVKVLTRKKHPLYIKVMSFTKTYKADTNKKLEIGDQVKIEQTRPISGDKRWKVVEVVKSGS